MNKNWIQLTIPFDFEEFKDIEGFEGEYQVSNYGNVFSIKSNKLMKHDKMNNGYSRVHLYKNGKPKNYFVHRLVATAFIPNPLKYKEVNHISEDKTDNRLCNLEWMSHKQNCNYGTRNERIVEKLSKAVLQFTKEGEFVKEYLSLMEAERQTGIFNQTIGQCCLGKRHSAGGFIWRYKKEEAA